jgi:hypothetical protein
VDGASYTVIETNSNGCSTPSAPFQVIMATGIGSVKSTITKIYPVPANDQMNIELSNIDDNSNVVITLYSLEGREIASYQTDEISNGKITISVRDINSGIYMLNVVSGKNKMVKKIVVVH